MVESISINDIESVEEIALDEVYDISMNNNHNYFIDAGKPMLVHNSSKTWDFFHFLVFYCDHNRNKWNEIYVLRDTLVNCRDFTLKEFCKCLTIMGIFEAKLLTTSPKPYYNLFGNHIYFRGLDDEKNTEGYPSDIAFVNEALETSFESIAGIKMRCRKLFVMDWNPKYTTHWAFELEGQPNVHFTHSTYKNNKHLGASIVSEIQGYEPTPENIKAGTADEFRWKVYGLGVRCAPEGLVFPNVTWIDSFPVEVERVFFGNDFGYTNDPNALVKIGVNGRNIYLQAMLYTPVPNAILLGELMKPIVGEDAVWADSADPGMISDLRNQGLHIFGAKKFAGCIIYRIDIMRRYNIHIVKDANFRKVQENYTYKKIQGISLNEPIDKFNHLWDAAGYACQHELR